ncbi:3'-5' exonuclease [Pseudoduganella umbonata]|uniref:Exonuclease domain-containing protein n=1 Tax=Pseudoduganella umbonata TaxID=864828 RepID=A0A4P8HXI6_9BURK|nr:3'-5' exonuclease [Pseudoduganella umbonata]MBB3224471.1 inhibitor of KinA sporulation pathway (predicted exonuclease) [Pseudoduganella umbonata]QCP13244.1 exonuclease domain-containing protein [Pseudoduganella umbonata]
MFLVIDLEATCSDDGTIGPETMEIIEIGACWADETGRVASSFQSFVRPDRHPVLTTFCTGLTGIEQYQVDTAPLFPDAAQSLRGFVAQFEATSIWMSWGAFDRKQLDRQSAHYGLTSPVSIPHINAKKQFAKLQKIGKEIGMARALALCGLTFLGTHHRAEDDALNIARMLPWVLGHRLLRDERPSIWQAS